MFSERTVAVVVPCHNEASRIGHVLRTVPPEADRIVVVDDGSTDGSGDAIDACGRADPRIRRIVHPSARGVGAAIAAGYRAVLAEGHDVAVVMAGDGQMDPEDFPRVVQPVAAGLADYCKGSRFTHAGGPSRIPAVRLAGNFVLSVLTKVVAGYWHISDTQCGYTAISREALQAIDVERIYPGYGCPNDILVRLNTAGLRVAEVPVRALYGVGEASKMRIPRVVLPIVLLLIRGFLRRLGRKYVIADGHPLVFAHGLAFAFLAAAGLLGVYLAWMFVQTALVMKAALIAGGISLSIGLQLLFTALWMDCHANQHLCIRVGPGLPGEPPAPARDRDREAAREAVE